MPKKRQTLFHNRLEYWKAMFELEAVLSIVQPDVNNPELNSGEELRQEEREKQMKISEEFGGDYMTVENFGTEPRKLTIVGTTKVAFTNSNGVTKLKPVLWFKGEKMQLALGVKMRKRMVEKFGDDTENWKGKRIEVFVDTTVEMGGEEVGGLRIRFFSPESAE